MATSDEFVEYLKDIFLPLGKVGSKRMFSGALLKVDGQQLGAVLDDVLYFKVVNEDLQAKYCKLDSEQFSYRRKDKKEPVVIKNWWKVPSEAMDKEEYLLELAEEVLLQY